MWHFMPLRYMDVILVRFFTFFNFYQLDVHIKTHVAFANLRRNIFKNRIENRISCDLVTVIESACLLTP